ncbi:MAG TPA: Ig-like domain-containing protein, partial [Acidobacteriaceae bacterium]|nr:Ig-like domain-containing protein [Acidobacteriaceae bacterium]
MRSIRTLVCVLLSFAAPAFATVTVTSPKSGATVTSPVSFVATATTTTCSKGVSTMGIYVNNKLTYVVNGTKMNTTLSLAAGSYSTTVEEWDHCGGASYTKVSITVSGGGSSKSGVTVTAPAANSTVTSPVSYAATATSTCAKGVASMGIYVNNKLIYVVDAATLNTSISLAAGAEHTVVEEWDKCGGAAYTTINLTVGTSTKTLTSIAVTPSDPSIAVGGTEQFTATATYSDKSTANISSTATWAVANTGVATIAAGGLATGKAVGSTQVTASLSGITGSDPVSVTAAGSGGVNVVTWHFDNNRSGLNANETSLSPGSVSSKTFGKLFSYLLDGYAYAEPLLMSNVTIKGATHNVVYVATEHDSVYAFDADSYGSGTPLWQVSLLKSGETPVSGSDILPWLGVTSTPVIDQGSNTIYVVSSQKSSASGSTYRLNALDITTGAQKFGGPVTIHASVAGTNSTSVNGTVSLPGSCIQRAALLLANGNVYLGFGNCHSGWLLSYNAKTLVQNGVFNSSPNINGEGKYGGAGGVWMGGGGPIADNSGNVYVSTGNGPWDGKTAYGDSILKFSSTLKLEDYFTPDNYAYLNCNDGDLAAGGLLLIPGSGNLVGGGKGGKLYLVNTANLGKEQANDAGAVQTIYFESDLISPYSASCTDASGTHTTNSNSYEIFGTSAYYNGSIFLGVTPTTTTAPAGIREFVYSGKLSYGAETKPSILENTRGTTPFISSDGNADGILWMIDTGIPLQQG